MGNKSFWSLFAMFLLGILVGFVFAPIKKGVNVRFSNNGNTYSNDDGVFDDDYEDWELDDCCDCDEDCNCDDNEAPIKF